MIYFLDTNIVIYTIENTPGFGSRATPEITRLLAAGHSFAVSDLVWMECRVHPIRQNDLGRLGLFDGFFASPSVQVFPLTKSVCAKATTLRATYNFSTPDALNLGAAIVHGCDRFLTADARLSRCADIPVDLLP